jgi:hypothetical protein
VTDDEPIPASPDAAAEVARLRAIDIVRARLAEIRRLSEAAGANEGTARRGVSDGCAMPDVPHLEMNDEASCDPVRGVMD